jgi:hypothetical protein
MSSFESLIAELSTSVGQGIYDSVRSNIIHEDQHYGPENKKDCPCDTCPMFDTCKVDMTECSAMRNWCSTGDFKDSLTKQLTCYRNNVIISYRIKKRK